MDDVIETLAALVAIDSVNPACDGGPGEAGVADFVRRFFAHHGIKTITQPVLPGRDNVVAILAGRDRSRRVVLEAHMDTVGVAGMTIPPWEPVIRDGRMHGRGACDTKAGLAAMMHALIEVRREAPPPCDVWLAAVVDEEHAFRGVRRLCEGFRAEAAIVAEPTDLRVVVATKGVLRWNIVVEGRAAHSSKPHLGINAVAHAARLVLAIDEAHGKLAAVSHPLLGAATGAVTMINGGVQINVVPERCVISIDRRLLPGEVVEQVLAGYQRLIDVEHGRDGEFRAVQERPMLVDEALDTAVGEAVVQAAMAVADDLGLPAEPVGVPYGSDASKLSRQGIPSIVFGPGSIDLAHTANESVPLDQVTRARDFYREVVRRFA